MSEAALSTFRIATRVLLVTGFVASSLLYLRRSKIQLACLGCDRGGSFYTCKPGTGYGSEQCQLYGELQKLVEKFADEAQQIKQSAMAAIERLRSLDDLIMQKIRDLANIVPNQIAGLDVFAQIAGALRNLTAGLSCRIDALKIDPCASIVGPLAAFLNAAASELLNLQALIRDQIVRTLFAAIAYTAQQMATVFRDIIRVLTEDFDLFKNFSDIWVVLRQAIEVIRAGGPLNMLIAWLRTLVPAGVDLYWIVVAIVLFFLAVIFGSIFGFINLLTSLFMFAL